MAEGEIDLEDVTVDHAKLLKVLGQQGHARAEHEAEYFSTDKQLSNACPNHLMEMNMFKRGNSRAAMQPLESELHFAGCEVGEKMKKSIHLMNSTTVTQRYHLLPPTTDDFKVSVRKRPGGVVPGMSDELEVEFQSFQRRPHYFDYLRVHCNGNGNVLIPLHAYPRSGACLPKHINYGPRSLVCSYRKKYKLNNSSSFTFKFCLVMESLDGIFSVSPTQGTMLPGSSTEITVTYAPMDFVTSMATLTLTVDELFSQPQKCNIVGSAVPGCKAQK